LETGIELACDSAMAGCDLLGFGEMGIGNTTAACCGQSPATRSSKSSRTPSLSTQRRELLAPK